MSSTDFVYGGGSTSGHDIPSTGFTIVTSNAPTRVAGQAIGAGGPLAGAVGSLSAARKTISAAVGFGSGSYSQLLDVALVVPALSQTGLYTATLTVAITAGP